MNYWLSFRDPDEDKNLGVTIIEGIGNIHEAIVKARVLNINPGGEVLGEMMTDEDVKKEGLLMNKLYTREDMIKLGYLKVKI